MSTTPADAAAEAVAQDAVLRERAAALFGRMLDDVEAMWDDATPHNRMAFAKSILPKLIEVVTRNGNEGDELTDLRASFDELRAEVRGRIGPDGS